MNFSQYILFIDSGGSSNIGPEMIVSPKDTTANQGDYTVDFECIVNARYQKMFEVLKKNPVDSITLGKNV